MTVDLSNLSQQIEKLKKEAGEHESSLLSASSSFSSPSKSDLAHQQELERLQKSIRKLTDEKLRAQWYPPTDPAKEAADVSGVKPLGLMGSAIDWISRPLYAVAGVAKHFTDEGEESLGKTVVENILREKSTFSGILRNQGVPSAISMPLGFALDVAMDPINWATIGTAAMIPRLAMGAYKGVKAGSVAKGVSVAARSGALEKATTAGRLAGFVSPGVLKSETFGTLAKKSLATTKEWQKFSGITPEKLVMERGFGVGTWRVGLDNALDKAEEASPAFKKFRDYFSYTRENRNWTRDARIRDVLIDEFGPRIDMTGAIAARRRGESIEPFLQEAERIREATPWGPELDFDIDLNLRGAELSSTKAEIDRGIQEMAGLNLENLPRMVTEGVDSTADLLKNPSLGKTFDPVENSRRLAGEIAGYDMSLEELEKIARAGGLGETGVNWFDKMMAGIREAKYLQYNKGDDDVINYGKKILDRYHQGMGIFRVAKVAASPTAWTNAVVGNLFMNHMGVGDLTAGFLRRLRQARDFYKDKPNSWAVLDNLFMNAQGSAITDSLRANKSAVRTMMGNIPVGKSALSSSRATSERVLSALKDAGMVSSKTKVDDLIKEIKAAETELVSRGDELLSKKAGTVLSKEVAREAGLRGTEGGLAVAWEAFDEAKKTGKKISRADMPTGMMGSELFTEDAAREMFRFIKEKAANNPNSLAWRGLNLLLNEAPSGYEKIDQTYKLASFIRSTVDGYSEKQLRRVRHLVQIDPEDFIEYATKGGQYRYRLAPEKALELSNVLYLNYAAMPAAVRVLRNFPILGSPFASFMYGMATKTGQTMVYNPSAFSKVAFAIQDFGGTPSPFEKKALEGPYYSYLKQPGMFRVPFFFEENPVYLNLANMIPYYSFNMFNPSEGDFYADSLPAKFVNAVHKSPLLKDPVGSVLFDYLIQPTILGEATAPKGLFGQALYPVDAGGLKKMAYGGRTLAESYIPNVLSFGGLIPGTEKFAEVTPLYRWRTLARARQGLNPLGISSSEGALSRTVRGTAATLGVPIQAPMNLAFTRREVQKELK